MTVHTHKIVYSNTPLLNLSKSDIHCSRFRFYASKKNRDRILPILKLAKRPLCGRTCTLHISYIIIRYVTRATLEYVISQIGFHISK